MTTMVNLTPHTVNVCDNNGNVVVNVPASGTVARCATFKEAVKEENGIPFFRTTYGAVEGLPEPQEGVIYIVSGLVLSALPADRVDVVAPGELVRNADGQPVGCKGFNMK